MRVDAAAALIAPAVRPPGGVWADLGAGGGRFSRALAELLGPEGHVYAVDRDPAAVTALARLPRDPRGAPITVVRGDLTAPDVLDTLGSPGGAAPPLDGVLIANALHFVPNAAQAPTLARLLAALGPGGRLVVVEYEDRAPSRWVPYPVSPARLTTLLPPDVRRPTRVGARPSAVGGTIYAAMVERPG